MPTKTIATFCVILTALLFITVSCKKKEEQVKKDERILIPVHQYYKDRYVYKTGTYWVFYDSLSSNIDSFAVESSIENVASMSGDTSYQGLKMTLGDYVNGTRNSTWKLSCTNEMMLAELPASGGTFYTYTLLYKTPPEIVDMAKSAYSKVQIQLIPSLNLNGSSIDSVYRIINTLDSANLSIAPYHDTILINGNVGLISMSINNNYIKKRLYLIRHNLVR